MTQDFWHEDRIYVRIIIVLGMNEMSFVLCKGTLPTLCYPQRFPTHGSPLKAFQVGHHKRYALETESPKAFKPSICLTFYYTSLKVRKWLRTPFFPLPVRHRLLQPDELAGEEQGPAERHRRRPDEAGGEQVRLRTACPPKKKPAQWRNGLWTLATLTFFS